MEEIACSKYHFLNGFWIKILALFFMTLDHIGIFLMLYAGQNNAMMTVGTVFRVLGRIALPLFIFLMVEGVRHTRSYPKYLLRLGIIALTIMIAQVVIFYFFDSGIEAAYSPILDVLVCSLVIYLINRKDKFSWFAILPIAYLLLCFAVNVYKAANPGTKVLWLPFYLTSGYNLLALLLSLAIYFARPLTKILIKSSENTANLENTTFHCSLLNCVTAFLTMVVILVCFLIEKIANCNVMSQSNIGITWGILACLFMLPYNWKRGYNKPWFKYGCYLYFPVHIVLIFAIFVLIFG